MDDFDTSDTEFYAMIIVRERLHHFFTALGFVGALADAAESIHYYQEQAEWREEWSNE